MQFEFATATRIIFAEGASNQLGAVAKDFGRRPLVVTGRNPARWQSILDRLKEQNLELVPYAINGEPDLETIQQGTSLGRERGCDFVIAIGGGSVIDSAKAIATMLNNSGPLLDFLEVIGHGKPLSHPALPVVAVPTTAGTGAEVTRNAVLAAPEHRVKVS